MNLVKLNFFAITLLVFFSFLTVSVVAETSIKNLKCEMLQNPTGIDVLNPRLSWQLVSSERSVMQKSYRILVASSSENLDQNIGDLWDSGQVLSDQSIGVIYSGKALKSRMNCYWKVKLTTEKDDCSWSEPAFWSMGLLQFKNWAGRWIGFDRAFPWDDDSFNSRLSARYFRKEFELSKTVKQARAYIIGLGLYELYFNGQKIGNQVLAPTPTDYSKNIKYNVFDVTSELRNGMNAMGVILGNGRFYTMRQHYKPYKINNYGFPKLLMQLEIEYDDGSHEIVKTDDSWKGTADGPIRSNNEYDGEEYDANKEFPGWNTTGFDDSNWLGAEYVTVPVGTIEAQLNPNMKIRKSFKPVSVTKPPSGKYIIDLGQNIAGWLKFTVQGNRGDTIRLYFAEILDDKGEISTVNLRHAKSTDTYILKGGEPEIWEPKFVYHGFRYVEITGWPGIPKTEDFIAQVVSDEMQVSGSFETSNALVNQIYKNAYWGILGNYKGMPVDCPQRDERQPWLGDRAVGSYGESFIFNNLALYSKWVDDIGWSQKDDGCIGDVVPAYWNYFSDNVTWPGTYILIANMIHQQYGDNKPIVTHYQKMKKWMEYMRENYMDENFVITKDSYGDWCVPSVSIEAGRGKSADVKRPSKFISTAYYYNLLDLMQKFARISGHQDDEKEFLELASSIKLKFDANFWNEAESGYGTNSLTDNLLALRFALVPETRKERLFATIVKIIEDDNQGHLSTGVIGVQWIMRTLTENGRADIAWKLASCKTYPSWGYMVENGATTIWELWNGNTAAPNMNSYNHVMMLGDLIIWFYENLAGIKTCADFPGFKQIEMKPELINGLDYIQASYDSPYGRIESNWKRDGKKFSWKISVPANSNAIIYLPAKSKDKIVESGNLWIDSEGVKYLRMEGERAVFQIGSGIYHFQSSLSN